MYITYSLVYPLGINPFKIFWVSYNYTKPHFHPMKGKKHSWDSHSIRFFRPLYQTPCLPGTKTDGTFSLPCISQAIESDRHGVAAAANG